MPNLTLSISERLKEEMEKHSSIKWSSVVRAMIEQKLDDFDEAERIAKRSRFTMKDWKSIGKRVSDKAARHAKALLDEDNG